MQLKKDRIVKLACFIDSRRDLDFNMGTHSTCIIGFAHRLWPELEAHPDCMTSKVLRPWLMLTPSQSDDLFFGNTCDLPLDQLTRENAVAALYGLVETSTVTWPKELT